MQVAVRCVRVQAAIHERDTRHAAAEPTQLPLQLQASRPRLSSSSLWRVAMQQHHAMIALLLLLCACLCSPSTMHMRGVHASDNHAPFNFSSCSAEANTCIRIGIFYCHAPPTFNASEPPTPPPPVTSCSRIRGYNRMLDWYRARVQHQLAGRIVGRPVQFVPLTLPPHSPSAGELARLVNDTFFEGERSLIDFAILPPGAAWDQAMLRLEQARIPSISAHAPLASMFHCAPSTALATSLSVTQPGLTLLTHGGRSLAAGAPSITYLDQPPCVAPNTRRFQFAHGLADTAEQYLQGWVSLLGLKKVETLSVVLASDAESDALEQGTPRGLRARMLHPMRIGVLQTARENHIRILSIDALQLRVRAGSQQEAANASLAQQDAAVITATVRKLKSLNPQAVVFLTLDCSPWLRALREADFAPGSVAASFCLRERDFPSASAQGGKASALARLSYAVSSAATAGSQSAVLTSSPLADGDSWFVVDSQQWSSRMNGHDYSESLLNAQSWSMFPHIISATNTTLLSSPKQFEALWQQLVDLPPGGPSDASRPSSDEAAVLAALSMLEGAITLSATNGSALQVGVDPVLVNRQLQLYFQTSFFGLMTTNRFGLNQQKAMVQFQRSPSGELQIVAPQSAAGMPFIYPMPSWAERVYVPRTLGRFPFEWVVVAALSACALTTLMLIGAMLRYRIFFAHTVRHHSQDVLPLTFFLFVGAGALMSFSTPFLWNVDNSAGMCRARLWVWTTAGHMVADPLVVACVCMARAVAAAKAGIYVPATTTLSQRIARGTVLLMLPQLLFNLLMINAYSGLQPVVIRVDPLRVSHSYTACLLQNDSARALLILSFVHFGLILCVGIVHGWRIRKRVSSGLFQDAQAVSLALALFAVTATVVLAVQLVLTGRSARAGARAQAVLFGLRSMGMLIATQGCFIVLVMRRLVDSMALAGVVVAGGVAAGQPAGDAARQARDRQASHRIALQSHALKSRVTSAAVPNPFQGPIIVGPNGVPAFPGASAGASAAQDRPDVMSASSLPNHDAAYPNVFSRPDAMQSEAAVTSEAEMMPLPARSVAFLVPPPASRPTMLVVVAPAAGGAGTAGTTGDAAVASPSGVVASPAGSPLSPPSRTVVDTPVESPSRGPSGTSDDAAYVLPDVVTLSALDFAAFRAWRQQLSAHAHELEALVSAKELERATVLHSA